MWLGEFLNLYPEAYTRVTGKINNYQEMVKVIQSLPATKSYQIGPEHLSLIEDKGNRYWEYPTWWPSIHDQLKEQIHLPTHLHTLEGKKTAIKALYGHLKHIEAVSVILRFTHPEHFGIISPPVTSMLNLVPVQNETNPEYFLRYLRALKDLSKQYCRQNPELQFLSNVDMGLWAAAHLAFDHRYTDLVEEMNKDAYFQEIRLRNLTEGFSSNWIETDSQRLILSRALLNHDHILAALIASRAFEFIINEIFARSKRRLQKFSGREDKLIRRIGEIQRNPDLLKKLGVSSGELNEWGKCRNGAVHPWTCNYSVTGKRARNFVRGVQRLYDNLSKI